MRGFTGSYPKEIQQRILTQNSLLLCLHVCTVHVHIVLPPAWILRNADDKIMLFIDIFLAGLCLMSRITMIEARPMPQYLHTFHTTNHP